MAEQAVDMCSVAHASLFLALRTLSIVPRGGRLSKVSRSHEVGMKLMYAMAAAVVCVLLSGEAQARSPAEPVPSPEAWVGANTYLPWIPSDLVSESSALEETWKCVSERAPLASDARFVYLCVARVDFELLAAERCAQDAPRMAEEARFVYLCSAREGGDQGAVDRCVAEREQLIDQARFVYLCAAKSAGNPDEMHKCVGERMEAISSTRFVYLCASRETSPGAFISSESLLCMGDAAQKGLSFEAARVSCQF